MKRILLATVAVAALTVPAAAADLAVKYPVKAIPAPVFSWTGFYIGANFGFGGGKTDVSYGTLAPTTLPGVDLNSSGFFVGGQIGYNYQLANNVVVGLEADLQWSDIEAKYQENWLGGDSASVKLDYFGTIRARLGYAYDRFLPYITGGAAYGKTKFENGLNGISNNFAGVSESSTRWGWTIGGGAEYAITNNWTFKAEYLYVDLGKSKADDSALLFGAPSYEHDNKFHTIKAGVNYKF
ncbi:outer membrane protein [Xanthobacter sp. TB0136]|uniref:outer membrane protein n=1 Tax=Xanthobacter sp. TB0136 TaxID=3459177 RepID=UPI004039C6C9